MSIYFYYGDEDYLIEKEILKFKSKLDKEYSEMNFRKYDNLSFADFISVLRTIPMMFGNMLIVVDCMEYLSKDFEKNQLDEIKSALDSNDKSVDIILTAIYPKNSDKKIKTKTGIFQLLKNYNSCEFLSIRTYKTSELSSIIRKMAEEKNIKIKQEVCNALIEHLGNNLRDFNEELNKLAIIIYPRTEVTLEDVKNNCFTNEDLFNLTEYLLKGEKGKAVLEYRNLITKKYPLEILSALQTMIRKWIITKLKSKNLSPVEISKLTNQHEYVVKQTIQKLNKVAMRDLVNLKQNLFDAEYRIKNAKSLNIEEEIEYALLK